MLSTCDIHPLLTLASDSYFFIIATSCLLTSMTSPPFDLRFGTWRAQRPLFSLSLSHTHTHTLSLSHLLPTAGVLATTHLVTRSRVKSVREITWILPVTTYCITHALCIPTKGGSPFSLSLSLAFQRNDSVAVRVSMA